jgi:EAL domain-containing protein (putative c-di-GMP-specific phosphodiesterase class I)
MHIVCAQLAHWAKSGTNLVPVSINISAQQFHKTDIAGLLSACIARYQIDPRLIEVELTESCMIGDNNDIAEVLYAMQRMGIKLSVDDFGTGYSSLAQLQRLDFDVLKVDRAFTAQLEESSEGVIFFRAIITMAHSLGMRVVAEGVETLDQLKRLRALQCDEVQGFLLSKPLPPSESQPVLSARLSAVMAR